MNGNQTKKRASRTAAAAAAVALAAALAPATAFAEPSSVDESTAVKLFRESGQVTVVVPTEMPAAITGEDGSFLTSGAAKFENKGVFPVHVSKIGVATSNSVNLVAKDAFADTSEPSTVWSTVAPGAGLAVDLAGCITPTVPSASDQWNIAGGAELPINLAGAMKNPGSAFTAADSAINAPVAFTITWTVASGAATTA